MSLPAKEHWLLATTSSRQRGMKQIFPSYPLEETNTAEALILDFWPPKCQRSELFFKPVNLWLLVKAALEN